MNLRFSLILLILGSWIAVGAAFIVDSGFGEEEREPDPPFFYNIPVDQITNIVLQTEGQTQGFHYREEVTRWFLDDQQDVPADLFRWGGITTLLGGPRTQRVVQDNIEDPAAFGLDNPSSRYEVTLVDGSKRVLLIGNVNASGESTYAQMEGYNQLVLVDTSWSNVLDRLVTEPPYPEWLYELNPDEVREVLLFENNEIVHAYGINRETDTFNACDLPVLNNPCTGTQPVDAEAFQAALDLIADHHILGAEALNLQQESDFGPYGTDRDAPYFAIQVERPGSTSNVTEVHQVSMAIGDVTPDGNARYAVANDTMDVIRIDRAWADQILELFGEEDALAGAPVTPTPAP